MNFCNQKYWLFLLASFIWLLGITPLQAQVAQAPLIVSGISVPPSIVFTLDDSGSMGFECQIDDLCDSAQAGVAPFATNTTFRRSATYNANSIYNRQMRSVQVNGLYYNPAQLYLPWLRSDLTRYPNSVITAAPVNPRVPAQTVNLAITQTSILTSWCTADNTASCVNGTETFYVPQYFTLSAGGSSTTLGSYTQTIIAGATSTYPKSADRTDCAATTFCSLAEEQQNFANWYTYYRSRIFAAIGGTAEAFQNVPSTYRIGYGRINSYSASGNTDIDGVNRNTLLSGVRPFTGIGRDNFYNFLFAATVGGGTPLRRAMGDVGEYFRWADNRGPWGNTPGTNDTTPQLACRRAYHILTTDGTWTPGTGADQQASNAAARGNVDNTNGPVNTNSLGQSFQNTASRPYQDSATGTLADVASYYWKTDLRPDLSNQVVASPENPAFWQSMVNYTVAFGLSGLLRNPADLPALIAGTLSWGDPAATVTSPNATQQLAKIDDLWHAAVNSRGRSFNASNPRAFADALQAIVNEIGNREGSEAGVSVSSRQLNSNSRKYVPEYRTGVWSGRLSAIPLDSNAEGDTVVWEAANSIPLPANRQIFTSGNTNPGGVTFTWADLQTAGLTTNLAVASVAQGTGLIAYLRGDRTGEGSTYRLRSSLLGDIVNSSPVLVRDLIDLQYDFLPSGTAGRDTYRQFLRRKAQRVAQVFVGANDGMLHAFSDVNGTETFAFVPRAVLGNLKLLATSPYNHRYFVDGPLLETDVYDAVVSDWRNLVVGGGGAGAKNLFAINVPTPSIAVATSTASVALYAPAKDDIRWEIASTDASYAELGNVLSTPEAGQMRDGTWVVVTGNGFTSSANRAQLFIINALTGALVRRIDTGAGSGSSPNGLGGVRVVRDANQRIVSAYAGDLLGNVWKFDLSSTSSANWNVAFGGIPLYRAVNRQGQAEPMTAAPTFVLHPLGGVQVLAGTGKLFEDSDPNTITERTLYGMWDRVAVGADSSVNSTTTGVITGTSSLVIQTVSTTITTVINGETSTFYTISANTVDYSSARGWRLPLTNQSGQRMVYDPQVASGRVFFETLVPGAAVATCQAASAGVGYNFVIDPFTGAAGLDGATFDTNGDGVINSADNKYAAVVTTKADGSDSILLRPADRPTPPPVLCTVAPCACGTPPCAGSITSSSTIVQKCTSPSGCACGSSPCDSTVPAICTTAPCSCGPAPCLEPKCIGPDCDDQKCGYTVASGANSTSFSCPTSSIRRTWRQLFNPPF